MQILNRSVSVDSFFDRLSGAGSCLLMLDYDGTLAPFVVDRDKAVPYQGVRERIKTLAGSERTRLVIVSGREIKRLQILLAIEPAPELFGCHGAERYHPISGTEIVGLTEVAGKQLHEIRDWASQMGLVARLETKPTSVAFHIRGMPETEAQTLMELVRDRWSPDLEKHDLLLHEFDGGMEIRLAGVTKGDVVKLLLKQMPDDTVAAYLGDDRTDEDAFAALGHAGLKVLVRAKQRDSAADISISPPDELLQFLDRWISATI
ncbi:MAG: trehalose-phosphatase [bacterium]